VPAVTVSDITILPRISDTTGLRARRVKEKDSRFVVLLLVLI
jgi:hypothetical protein